MLLKHFLQLLLNFLARLLISLIKSNASSFNFSITANSRQLNALVVTAKKFKLTKKLFQIFYSSVPTHHPSIALNDKQNEKKSHSLFEFTW